MPLTLRVHTRLAEIPAERWDTLRASDNPFLSHAFLSGLETQDCIRADLGWQAWHLAWYRDDALVAALPAYLKGNSHGEFVFDWSWAQACEQSGKRYYPKLLCGVPYSPVPGPRLLTGRTPSPPLERALADSLIAEARRLQLSGVHINFPDDASALRLERDRRWLPRRDLQFHWRNADYGDFDEFLSTLSHKKRKNIRQEREHLFKSGWRFDRLSGGDIDDEGWNFIHTLYVHTFADKGNHPALSAGFFRHLGCRLPEHTMVVVARAPDGRPAAMALFLHGGGRLYGRYWGCLRHVPGLHFECCYYQGIEFAIERKMEWFEPGAQGEHKLARGFLPVYTRSFHHLLDPLLHARIAQALAQEHEAIADWRDELMAGSPYACTPD
jgi:hypothetical protein